MRRRTVLRAAGGFSLLVAAAIVVVANLEEEGPGFREAPAAPPPVPKEAFLDDAGAGMEIDPGPPPWEVEAGVVEDGDRTRGAPAAPPADPDWWERQAEVLRDESWKAYPPDATGPVVVGVLVKAGDTDPAAWVALEDMDRPGKEDPSVPTSLDWGRFRLTKFEPGRYRVRAKTDDGCAVYSEPFTVGDGEVADAGILRLQRPGSISGTVHGPDGDPVDAVVRLFGRNPASLERVVVETRASRGREGFRMLPHEAGEFVLAAVAPEGYAIHRGTTDGTGLGWAEIRLHPWCSLAVRLAPGAADAPEARLLSATLEPTEVPDLGVPAEVRTRTGPGTFSRLVDGRYRLAVRWAEKVGGRWVDRAWEAAVLVPERGAETVEVPR